jgi:hypothetical protein
MLKVNGVDKYYLLNTAAKPQTFTSNNDSIFNVTEPKKVDKSCNGKFNISEAGKNFLKGIFSPVTAVIEHPLATVGMVAGTVAACSVLPILGPALAVGFGAYSLYQAGKGCLNVVKNCANGDYDAAEKSFGMVGEGTIGTVLSALGVKQGARVAKEAKLMNELNTTTLTSAQKTSVAKSVNEAGFISNLKENLSLFTTKSGLNAVVRQFKPDMLKARYAEIKNMLDLSKWTKEKEVKGRSRKISTKEQIENFKKSPEGLRRAALSDEQITAEVKALYDEAFEKLGVPKEQRPKLEIVKKDASHGGSYSKSGHRLSFNPETYRSGLMEIEDVIMHEATHCREALMRAGIPQDRVDTIVTDELINRIRNGESEKIIKGASFIGADMADPPKMSVSMRDDFIKFAKENLFNNDKKLSEALNIYDTQANYKNSKYLGEHFDPKKYAQAQKDAASVIEKLKAMITKHPDFVKQCGTEEEALNVLMEYSLSHNFRYNYFTNTKINKSIFSGNLAEYVEVKPLSGDALAHAEQSLVDEIATIEGNGRVSGIKLFGYSEEEFNQYQFSPEEVLAQKNGNSYLIEKITIKMNEMKKAGTLTPEQETYMTKIIEKAKVVIEYKTKGFEFYKKYTQMINNPNDKKLASEVKTLKAEIDALKTKITPEEMEAVTKTIKVLTVPEHTAIDVPAVAIYQLLNSLEAQKAA